MTYTQAPANDIDRARTILRVAWLAVLLGIGIELLVVFARLIIGANSTTATFLAELSQEVSWALVACVGVVIGTTAAKARALVSGLLGLISGPLGWGLAKAAQRVTQTVLGTPPDKIGTFFYILCAVKGVEYLVLAAILGHLSEKSAHDWRHYAGIGAAVGFVATVVVIALNIWFGLPMAPAKLAGLAVSEFLFPIGCALVIFAPLRLKHYIALD